jgi:hypothetical protein
MTGLFGSELLIDSILPALGVKNLDSYLYRLAEADEEARRAFAWKWTARMIPEMKRCHETFDVVVEEILDAYENRRSQLSAPGTTWETLAKSIFKPRVQSLDVKVVWTINETHCNYSYALNRFLSAFLNKLMKRAGGYDVLRPSTRVLSVESADTTQHQCVGADALGCYGHRHKVTFSSAPEESFDIVILRHGLIFVKDRPIQGAASVPEQIVPYEIPF